MANPENPSISSLKERFRHGIRDLAAAIPLSEASLSVRFAVGAPLDAVLTLGFGAGSASAGAAADEESYELSPLVIGEAAAQWFEANRRELVLDVRPDQSRSEFYKPFLLHGLQSVVVVPIFGVEGLIGALAFGANERHAWTRRHLKLMQLLAAQLAGEFPHPAPAAEQPATFETDETAEEHSLRVGSVEPPPVPAAAPPAPMAPSVDDAHVEADGLGRLREWDPAAERLFGLSRDEAIGRSLAFFYRETGAGKGDRSLLPAGPEGASHKRLLSPFPVEELTARGRYTGRILAWDADGRELACEVEVIQVRTATGARGFRGRFRRVEPDSPVDPRELRFDVARRYAFANSVISS